MATLLAQAATEDVDYLLDHIVDALQLSKTQYANAEEKYRAIARWLGADGSPLAALRPVIYAQGSVALGTTLPPWKRIEYDLDLVLQVLRSGWSAMQLYNADFERLWANATYRPLVEPMKRCVRINYAGAFHLDIIPAQPDWVHGGTAIEVPDRKLVDWTPSNPLGFVRWFHDRARGALLEKRVTVHPLPGHSEADDKTTLALAVQLIKRRRDVMYQGGPLSPRSIVLTTLAGHHYRGSASVAQTVLDVLYGIEAQVAAAAPGRIIVCNPTNAGERFCESFTPESYEAFRFFVRSMRTEMDALIAARGFSDIQSRLAPMFGTEPVAKALTAYTTRLNEQRSSGALRFGHTSGVAIVGGAAAARHIAPVNNFYGE